MNIRIPSSRQARGRRDQRGMAVIVVIALIAILLIYISGNLRALHFLSRDLKQIEQKQLRRLRAVNPATHSVALTNLTWTVEQTQLTGVPPAGLSK
jgi:type II secretory pathway component PulK